MPSKQTSQLGSDTAIEETDSDLRLYRKSKLRHTQLQSAVLILILGFVVAIMAIVISSVKRFDRRLQDLHIGF